MSTAKAVEKLSLVGSVGDVCDLYLSCEQNLAVLVLNDGVQDVGFVGPGVQHSFSQPPSATN